MPFFVGMNIWKWIQVYDSIMIDGDTDLLDLEFPYKNVCPQLLLGRFFEHPKHMLKLIGKKMIAILCS